MTKMKESNSDLFQKIQNLKNENFRIEQQISEADIELYKIAKEINVFSNIANINNEPENIKELKFPEMYNKLESNLSQIKIIIII